MIEIASSVWLRWDERRAEGRSSIALLLSARTKQRGLADAVRDSVSDAIGARDPGDDLPPGFDEPRTGHCVANEVLGGVLLQIEEAPDDFEGLVRLIAAGLE